MCLWSAQKDGDSTQSDAYFLTQRMKRLHNHATEARVRIYVSDTRDVHIYISIPLYGYEGTRSGRAYDKPAVSQVSQPRRFFSLNFCFRLHTYMNT